ncbi:hypothetical protein RCO48_15420 [Peribacillus frigoritolerans]|nr:hypothetical protein [Peribacillus frigoritolerans]
MLAKILNGTTGHTTTWLIYDFFCSLKHGEEKAKLYYVANAERMGLSKDLVEKTLHSFLLSL